MINKAIPLGRAVGRPARSAPAAIPIGRAGAMVLFLPVIICLWIPADASARQGWYPAAGVTWANSTDPAVGDLYASGPGAMAAMGYSLEDRLRIEVRLDWFRRTAQPYHHLAEHAESRLTHTPFSLEAHVRFRRGSFTPYLLAGPSLVFSQERFRYTLLGREREAMGRRSNLGAALGAGMEMHLGRARGRLSLRAVLAGGNREVLRATGRTDPRSEPASASFWTLGFEVQPW